MRIWISLAILVLVIPMAMSLKECQRTAKTSDIPCNIISSYLPSGGCSQPIFIFNQSGTLIQSYNWSDYTPTCNVTFNISNTGTYYYNSTIEDGIITVEPDDNMIYLLFIPLGLCFFFIYWGNSLNEGQEPLKWFTRLLSLVMIFTLYIGAHIIIANNPGYEDLNYIFNIDAITWIFFTIIAAFLVFFIYKIFMAFQQKKNDDFENGILR